MSLGERLERELAARVEGAGSLEEAEGSLLSLPEVISARRMDFLMKSNPPQRIIELELRDAGGFAVRKEIVFWEVEDGRFRFRELRDSATT